MKIIKTLLKTEIEITPDELKYFYADFHPNTRVWLWVCRLLKIEHQINER